MTKVKSILAEFCSPKEIQAISRLGLIKKEERESQPIPWRHRLPIAERRKLVKTEMRSTIRPAHTVTSRDKSRALTTARSPKDSKMGECLININIRGDPSLGTHIGRIDREQRRQQNSYTHSRQTFIRRSQTLNHEPLILVERPPSPNVRTRALLMTRHGIDPDTAILPSYMRPLNTRNKTPSTLTTIEAYTVETKKKKNVWEEVLEEKEAPKFKSMVRPSARLSTQEVTQLRIGHSLHKPTTESIAAPRPESAKEKLFIRPRSSGGERGRGPSVFITQLQEKDLAQTADDRLEKSAAALARFTSTPPVETLISSQTVSSAPSSTRLSKPSGTESKTEVKAQSTKKHVKVAFEAKEGIDSGGKVQAKETKHTSQTVPPGRERSEKKLRDFLSVLLEEPRT